jgi:hypothetical protein
VAVQVAGRTLELAEPAAQVLAREIPEILELAEAQAGVAAQVPAAQMPAQSVGLGPLRHQAALSITAVAGVAQSVTLTQAVMAVPVDTHCMAVVVVRAHQRLLLQAQELRAAEQGALAPIPAAMQPQIPVVAVEGLADRRPANLVGTALRAAY